MQVSVKNISDFYAAHPECVGRLSVSTRHGYKVIEYADVTSVNSEMITVETDTRSISVSPDHLLHDGEKWIKTRDLVVDARLLCVDGLQTVRRVTRERHREDLYDLQVAEVKEYYANGFVSHNSTLIEALTYAAYGKSFRGVKKGQLVNSINQKGLEVELAFTTPSGNYVVRRGQRPHFFEIWRDGVLVNQDAAARDYQRYLEDQVLKMNYHSFCQVVILGSAAFVPFMQLSTGMRREVIEDLLDLQVFSTMSNLLRDRVITNKERTTSVEHELQLTEARLKYIKEHNKSIRKIREETLTRLKTDLAAKTLERDEENQKTLELKERIAALESTIADESSVQGRYETLSKTRDQLRSRLQALRAELEFYHDHDSCPTCHQDIKVDFKKSVIRDKVKTAEQITLALEQIRDLIARKKERLDEISATHERVRELKRECSESAYRHSVLSSAEEHIRAEIMRAESQTQQDSALLPLGDATVALQKKQEELEKLKRERDLFSVASSVLKDGGIKAQVIKQYVPIINTLINHYLSSLDFFVDFQLDENFNEKILSRHRDEFSYNSFSEGEKLRLDLAVLFAWRAVAKRRNSVSTNLLIMDEVLDRSLDSAGTEDFLRILNETVSDNRTNIFIVSHKGDALYDRFDHVIRFEKYKNFSRMVENT